MKPPRAPLAALAGWLVFAASTSARTAATPPKNPVETKTVDEVVELSPFLVVTTENAGWVLNETLAGTRFRTKLGDLAPQMEILTMDFMDEFGFTNVEQAAVYSLNIENSTEFVSNEASKSGGEDTVPLGRLLSSPQ